jgi:NADH dehydrogenase
MYLGAMWFIQGIHKIQGGWLKKANDFVSVASSKGGEAAHAAADAVSAASDEAVVEVVVDTVTTASGAVEEVVSAAGEVVAEAAAYGPALLDKPLGIYMWIAENTVNYAPHFFQSGIVIFELLIGLALIGGAFTWLSAAASFVFSIMLIIGAMTDASIFWYMVAALAMLGGAGRSFGLDYWIMPFCKNLWNSTTLAQRTHLYVGEPSRRKKRK